MPEINHGEPTSIIETHLGAIPSVRDRLEAMVDDYIVNSEGNPDATVDRILDLLIVEARPVSGFASLFLKRVKDGRL